jgi:hypothetical protein
MMYCAIRRVISTRDLTGDIDDAAEVELLPMPHRRWSNDSHRSHPGRARNARGRTDPLRMVEDHAFAETVALLEAAAIALGAATLTPAGMSSARHADRELRACQHDPDTAVRWARLFHHTLLTACPNRHMLDLIDLESFGHGAVAMPPSVGGDEVGRISDDHEAILDLIAAGAPRSELERSLRRHASMSTLCSTTRSGC